MADAPPPVGTLVVPALAAFVTCLVVGLALSALLGLPMQTAVPAGIVVSALAAVYAAFSYRRSRGPARPR